MFEPWMVFVLLAVAGIGIAIGYAVGRSQNDAEEKQKQAEEELSTYKEQVAQHFGKTAELFDKLTHDYRDVYEHLAQSSENLCGDQVPRISAGAPEGKLLAENNDDPDSSIPVESAGEAAASVATNMDADKPQDKDDKAEVEDADEPSGDVTEEKESVATDDSPARPEASDEAESSGDMDHSSASWKSPVVAPPAAEAVDADIMAEADEQASGDKSKRS